MAEENTALGFQESKSLHAAKYGGTWSEDIADGCNTWWDDYISEEPLADPMTNPIRYATEIR